jgi:hypothetical protein
MEDRGIRHLVASNVAAADAGPRVIADERLQASLSTMCRGLSWLNSLEQAYRRLFASGSSPKRSLEVSSSTSRVRMETGRHKVGAARRSHRAGVAIGAS